MKFEDSSINWQSALQQANLEMQTPTRPAGLVSDLIVPFGQALVTGFLIAGLITFVASRSGFKGELIPFFWGLALTIWAAAWLWILVDTRKLLRQIEKLTGLDLDGDGTAGEPPQEKRVLEVHVNDGGKTRIIESELLGIDDERLIAFSVGMNNGRGLTEAEWGKSAVFAAGINEFRAFRSKLLEAGLITWVDPNKKNLGYEVTGSGRAFFRRIAALEEEE